MDDAQRLFEQFLPGLVAFQDDDSSTHQVFLTVISCQPSARVAAAQKVQVAQDGFIIQAIHYRPNRVIRTDMPMRRVSNPLLKRQTPHMRGRFPQTHPALPKNRMLYSRWLWPNNCFPLTADDLACAAVLLGRSAVHVEREFAVSNDDDG